MTTQPEKDSDITTTKMVEFPSGSDGVNFDDDGVDGELIEDGEAEEEMEIVEKNQNNRSSKKKKDNLCVKRSDSKSMSHSDKESSSNESPNKRKSNSSEHRKHHSHHHHHHHNSNDESNRKRRKLTHSGEEGEDEGDRGSRRSSTSHRQSTRSDRGSVSSSRNVRRSRSRDRKYSSEIVNYGNKYSSSQSQRRSPSKSKSRNAMSKSKDKDHRSSEESISPVPPHTAKKRESLHKELSITTASESAEAEDGEILEEGELSDDNDDDTLQASAFTDSSREDLRGSPVKPSRRDDKRDKNNSRDNKDRRKEDDKKKNKKYVDLDKTGGEDNFSGGGGSGSAPAWGSGYQGASKKAKTSPGPPQGPQAGTGSSSSGSLLSPFGKSMKGGRNNNKGNASPPGLYDSPSYSEDSEPEESMTKSFGMLADGYVDASVAADEKEGIFKRNAPAKKKKKNRGDRSQGKRKNMDFGKGDAPPVKKMATERPICKFYRDGKCSKGVGCTFNHDVEQNKRMEVCKYHMSVKGCHKEKCLYMHEDFPCKYYHTGQACYSGERCKFSHDPLTEDTRRALEMRVAAEDIIDMEDQDYDYDYDSHHDRRYEGRGRNSLLGSPPRRHPDLKKIPSLFDIETHPPVKSPKPSPQPQRPSGFYSEANQSPKPGSSAASQLSPTPSSNSNNSVNNNANMGMVRPVGPPGGLIRAPGPAAAAGLMAVAGAVAGNRMPFAGNQPAPGNNPVLNMLGAIIREAAIQKVGPVMMNAMATSINNMSNSMSNNNNNINNNNNVGMFGPMDQMRMNNSNNNNNHNNNNNNNHNNNNNDNSMNNNMNNNNVPSSVNQNLSGPGVPDGASVTMQQQHGLDGATEGDMMDVDYRIKAPAAAPSSSSTSSSSLSSVSPAVATVHEDGTAKDECERVDDVDLKATFDESEDASRDLSELDLIRRRIQEQIDNEAGEEEEEEGDIDEEEGKLSVALDMLENNGGLSPDHLQEEDVRKVTESESKQETQSMPVVNLTQEDLEKIEVPTHLPKKQRELFMRIQQQHLLREKQKEQQEALKVMEQAEVKVEKDDWYSDSDEETSEAAMATSSQGDHSKVISPTSLSLLSKAQDVPTVSVQPSLPLLPSLSPQPAAPAVAPSLPPSISSAFPLLTSMAAAVSSSASKSDSFSAPQSSTSTINIMQMINAIRKQTTGTSKDSTTAAVPEATTHSNHSAAPPKSPPPLPSLNQQQSPKPPPPPPPPPFVDPPVVSATPKMPLVYAIVRIALDLPRIYTILPTDVNPSHSKYRFDPRVKRHFQLVNKQPPAQGSGSSPSAPVPPSPKESQLERKLSTEEKEKQPATKPVDPRLKQRTPSVDPRLQKPAGSSPRLEDPRGDPRLDPRLKNKDNSMGIPQPQQKVVDPRLAKRALGPMDPRLNRQMSQEMGGGGMGMGGNVGGPMNTNNMMGNGGMLNGGPSRPQFQGMLGMGGGPPNRMGGPMMNNMMGGPPGNSMLGGHQGNNMMGNVQGNNGMDGPQMSNNMMSGQMGNMGGPQANIIGGPQGNMMGSPQGNMTGPQGSMGGMQGSMGGPHGNMMGNNNNMGGPKGNMMGGGSPGNILGNPQSGNANVMVGNRGPIGMNSSHPMDRMGMAGPSRPFNNNIDSSPNNEINTANNNGNINDPRFGPRQAGNNPNNPRSSNISNNMSTTDPRLRRDPRSAPENPRDPRSVAGDPRDPRSVPVEPKDPRSAFGEQRDPRSAFGEQRDPRSAFGEQRDPRSAFGDPRRRNSTQQGIGGSPNSFQKDLSSSNNSNSIMDTSITLASQMPGGLGLPPLPPLSSSASLPPLPSLSPPSLPPEPSTPKDPSTNTDNKIQSKKFDYRNDPRFKRVKRTAGPRKSSMDYSSPLGMQEDNEESVANSGSGSPQYNGYNRPKPPPSSTPPTIGNVHARRQNAPSPSLPDTLQDFDLPELPSQPVEAAEPDFKVKDLFKSFDPTASPFC